MVSNRKPPDLLHGVFFQLHNTGQEGPSAAGETLPPLRDTYTG